MKNNTPTGSRATNIEELNIILGKFWDEDGKTKGFQTH